MVDRRQVLLITAGPATFFLTSLSSPLPAMGEESVRRPKPGRLQPFDLDWRFNRGDGDGFQLPGLDDGGWRVLDVPHDWSIEDLPSQGSETKAKIVGPFAADATGGLATGFTVGGIGWYRERVQGALLLGNRRLLVKMRKCTPETCRHR
jgi:beta-galactosidase